LHTYINLSFYLLQNIHPKPLSKSNKAKEDKPTIIKIENGPWKTQKVLLC
jgi:hypothetical protein